RWGWYHGGYWYPSPRHHHHDGDYDEQPEQPGQGYDEFPYANDSGFVRSHVTTRRYFGAFSGQFFDDARSQTPARRLSREGARGLVRGERDYSYYAEPSALPTDRLHTFRLAVGLQPRLGNQGYFIAAVGVRGIALNNGGQTAGGPEGELGVQLLPKK